MKHFVSLACALALGSVASAQDLSDTPAEAIAGGPDFAADVEIDVVAAEHAIHARDIDLEHTALADQEIGEVTPIDLPSGEAKSAVTPQRISLPSGEGSIEGMGESFTPNLSSGTGTYAIPISLPPGRNGVQPSLALSYGTSSGNGVVGFGWSLGVPFIARQSDRGLPSYVDAASWHPQEDRFSYNGGQELVPVDSAAASAIDGGVVPLELASWQEYRARVEGGFMRFFRSPDLQRWIVQDRSGTRFEFGLVLDGPPEIVADSANAVQREPETDSHRIFAWLLTRMSDAHGSTVYYRYVVDGGQRYLRDIHYVSPSSCAAGTPTDRRRCVAPLSDYGRRVALVYEARPDAFTSYISTWAVTTAWRLRRIEVTAAEGLPGLRTLVRRYHLTYAPEATSFHSLLTSVALEGRPHTIDPVTGVALGDAAIAEAALGEALVGDLLPAMRFRYSVPEATSTSVAGFGGIDATVHRAPHSPAHSFDEARTDLFDVNSDGLTDVIVTDPATYRTAEGAPAVGVFFNGFGAGGDRPSTAGDFSRAIPIAVPSTLSHVMTLSNANIAPMDIDGDGRSDLLHMPRSGNYGYFAVTRNADESAVLPSNQGWAFTHVPVTLPEGITDPRIDFGRDGAFLESVDVDNDHLIDIVRTSGTEMQTWLNLGNYPGGDGRFGSARFEDGAWVLSTEPVASCVLRAGRVVDFEDSESRLADMNGDGLQDIVQMRRGSIVYWPGRGIGLWGEGSRDCAASATGTDRHIAMLDAPEEINPELAGVELADVNSDGASDVVQVGFDRIDVWFNRAGRGFTARVTATLTPFAPAFLPRTRFADIDGSGTVDIVYGNGGRYEWIDPMGGLRPRLLVEVDNGLGALTTLEYAASSEDYLRDLSHALTSADGEDRFTWQGLRGDCDAQLLARAGACVYRSGGSPVVSTVVRSVVTTDRFDALGREENATRAEYSYHDGYYEGIEQEFRGFGAADLVSIGDFAHPTSIARSFFHQGRRPNEIASDRLADNPNEQLKGQLFLTETFDEHGVYQSTQHTTFTVRTLLDGLDGSPIRYAYASRSDELRYDTAPFTPISETIEVDAVVRESAGGESATVEDTRIVQVRGDRYARMASTTDVVDDLGHVLQATTHGRVRGEFGEVLPDERIIERTEVERLADESGWHFQVARSWIEGADGIRLGETINTYEPTTGDLLRTDALAMLATAMAYEFAGDGSAQSFTHADQTIVTSTGYDAWGSATRTCAGGDVAVDEGECLRYAETEYDADFGVVAIRERAATRRSGGVWTFLETSALWDRGLDAVLSATDPNGLVAAATYDGFGRMTSQSAPPVAGCEDSTVPTTRFFYTLTLDPESEPLSWVRAVAETSCASVGASTLETVTYFDGLARPRASLATGDDEHAWVRSGIAAFTERGTAAYVFQADFFDIEEPGPSAVVALPTTPVASLRYDAFGRVRLAIAEDGSLSLTEYHALSTDACDPNDLDATSPHFDTCSTVRTDGHGRTIDTVARNRQPLVAGTEYYRLWSDYRADGAVLRVARAETSTDAPRPGGEALVIDNRRIEREFAFDTAGRRVAATDPDADARDPAATDANRAWRYLTNRVGDLVAVRDPRGCGQNFYYDRGGRLIGEAYVTCEEAQPSGEIAVDDVPQGTVSLDELAAPVDVHVRLFFDEYPDWATGAAAPPSAGGVLGRATGVSDRGMRTVVAFDDRGNAIWEARQIALAPETSSVPASLVDPPGTPSSDGIGTPAVRTYDEATTYLLRASFDHAARPVSIELPEDVDWSAMGGAGAAPVIAGRLEYNRRGLPASTELLVDGTAHPVMESVSYLRDGLVGSVVYGDHVGGTRAATISTRLYDARRRTTFMQTIRAPGAPASGATLGEVSVLNAQRLHWDAANNLTWIEDLRTPEEWPDGHRPQSVRIAHDALYRVASADFEYALDGGATSATDLGLDWRAARENPNGDLSTHRAADPMRSRPAPMLPDLPESRVTSLTWEYDWLGNNVDWTDDAHAFFERSIGDSTSGDIDAGERPTALRLASNLPESEPAYDAMIDRGGYAELDYGDSGNVVAVTVHAECRDVDSTTRCYDDRSTGIDARRTALRARCECASEQHFRYLWDEVNRLVEARRYDRAGIGTWDLRVRQRARYNGANERIVKQTISFEPGDMDPPERTSLSVFPGDYERRGVIADPIAGTYERNAVLGTESEYQVAGARVVWKGAAEGAGLDRDHRVTFAVSDLLGSTSAVIDLRSGEALEAMTFYPNGARETWLSQDDVSLAPERAGFTGKEADEEVGLVYFGERHLMPHLGRWASPDPAQLHALGGGDALNNYHYVAANLFQSRDPIGLAPDPETEMLTSMWKVWRAGQQAADFLLAPYDSALGKKAALDHMVPKSNFRNFADWDNLTIEQKFEIWTDESNLRAMSRQGNSRKGASSMAQYRTRYPSVVSDADVIAADKIEDALRSRVRGYASLNAGEHLDVDAHNIEWAQRHAPDGLRSRLVDHYQRIRSLRAGASIVDRRRGGQRTRVRGAGTPSTGARALANGVGGMLMKGVLVAFVPIGWLEGVNTVTEVTERLHEQVRQAADLAEQRRQESIDIGNAEHVVPTRRITTIGNGGEHH